ncbi:MAG TPA: hypothetical protein VHZ24_20940 [Pirellulales bacterium]|nr:hypothetical protein [Pirellulales bacterium]
MQITSHHHPYSVSEHATVDDAFADLDGDAFVLLDQKVDELYGERLRRGVAADRTYAVEATEFAKSYEQLTPVFTWLLERRCRRNSHLVVIGGGVLQDIGCFIASVLMRGIRWTLVPTTLLAQCDSCIGSKSSLNIGSFKNQLGTFYAPHEVRLAVEFLNTLSREEILSGLGEAIKLHLIAGETEAAWLWERLAETSEHPAPLGEIIRSSLQIKKRFIEVDEFDQGIRNLLNYGHTFAHAFESASRFAIPHGIAVTLGVACATIFSRQLAMLPADDCEELIARLRPYFGGYERVLGSLPVPAILAAMKQDKKNVGDRVTFILTRGAGRMEKKPVDIAHAGTLLQECVQQLTTSARHHALGQVA